jgi:hypothetical protein
MGERSVVIDSAGQASLSETEPRRHRAGTGVRCGHAHTRRTTTTLLGVMTAASVTCWTRSLRRGRGRVDAGEPRRRKPLDAVAGSDQSLKLTAFQPQPCAVTASRSGSRISLDLNLYS